GTAAGGLLPGPGAADGLDAVKKPRGLSHPPLPTEQALKAPELTGRLGFGSGKDEGHRHPVRVDRRYRPEALARQTTPEDRPGRETGERGPSPAGAGAYGGMAGGRVGHLRVAAAKMPGGGGFVTPAPPRRARGVRPAAGAGPCGGGSVRPNRRPVR